VEFKEKVIKALEICRVQSGARIVTGFSGGPDSTALLHILHQLENDYRFTVFAAYLDHGIRKKAEIEKEIQWVKQTAASLRIEIFIGRIPSGELQKIAGEETRSIEEVAREKRYQFLEAVSKKVKAEYIAMGHTEDDHIETIVMRFFQGSGISGLAGIPLFRDTIIRPLYYCTKEEIHTYLKNCNLHFMEDSTNRNRVYLRNKIRWNLIPVVRNIFPGYQKGLMRLSELFFLVNDYFDKEIEKSCPWEKALSGYRISREQFCNLHSSIRLFSLYKICNKLYDDEKIQKKKRIPFRFLSPVLNPDTIKSKRIIIRGYGIVLLSKGPYLFCRPDIVSPREKGYLIHIQMGKKIKVPAIGCIIHTYNGKKEAGKEKITLCENCIHYPLVIRSRRPGDKIKSGKGSKSLKKLFNEWKIPGNKRWAIPVLADRKQILGIAGTVFGYKNRFAPGIQTEKSGDSRTVTVSISRIP
jgi:tRNA(Ile)-lysidine synthase